MTDNYTQLREVLLQGVCAAWQHLVGEVNSQKIYVFSIDPGDLGMSASLSANTETVSDVVDYQSLERLELRWSMPDWDFAFFGASELAAFNAACNAILPDPYSLSDRKLNAHVKAFYGMCISVLQELDHKELFGRGPARDQIVLGLILTDQSDRDMVKYAKALNPAPVADRFKAELRLLRELQRKTVDRQ